MRRIKVILAVVALLVAMMVFAAPAMAWERDRDDGDRDFDFHSVRDVDFNSGRDFDFNSGRDVDDRGSFVGLRGFDLD